MKQFLISNFQSMRSKVKFPTLRFKFCTSEGFTLIEMIVSLAIFSVVAVVALGALMKIISANKKAQSLMSTMTNVSFALESMSREMRMGADFNCDAPQNITYKAKPCSKSGQDTVITFTSSNTNDSGSCSLKYAYSFLNDTNTGFWDLKKAQQPRDSVDCSGPLNNSFSIIDPNVIITNFYVNVTGDSYQLATLRVSGYVGARERERTYFDVQTAISARLSSN